MLIDERWIATLIRREFVLDCTEITLSQQDRDDPVVYSGPGTIYQDQDGSLNLKAFHSIKDFGRELSLKFKHHTLGKIIPSENYFHLRAVDVTGHSWRSQHVWVGGDISLSTGTHVVKAKLGEIRDWHEHERIPAKTVFMVVPGEYQIPFNTWGQMASGDRRLNTAKAPMGSIDLELVGLEDSLRVHIASRSDLPGDSFERHLAEALSLALARPVNPLLTVLSDGKRQAISIKSLSLRDSVQAQPSAIPHSEPSHLGDFVHFLEKYVSFAEQPNSSLFGFWQLINQSWSVGIKQAALAIAVSTEGMLRAFFSKEGLPDSEIMSQAERAEEMIRTSVIGERISQRLLSSIASVRSGSAKSALYSIASRGLVSQDLAEAWIKLRNKSVHADKPDLEQGSIQEYADLVFACLTLFYALVFLVIGYDGKYIDFAKHGWPEVDFGSSAGDDDKA